MEHDAEYLAVLADKMALVPSRGGALFQNIQSGGRQSLTHLSKPSIRSTLKASRCHFSRLAEHHCQPCIASLATASQRQQGAPRVKMHA